MAAVRHAGVLQLHPDRLAHRLRYELYRPDGGAHKPADMKAMITVTEESAPSTQD